MIKLVNYCIYNAVKDGASDIHIEPGDNMLRVRYRIDGRLTEKLRPPHQMHAAVASRIKIMAGLDISERRLPQDGGIHVMMDKRPIDLRVSTMPGKHGEKVVIRVIDNDKARSISRSSASATTRSSTGENSSACPTASCWSPAPPAAAKARRSMRRFRN